MSNIVSIICIILIITDNYKERFTKIQNEKKFRSHSIKIECIIMFGLCWTLHEIESAIKSAIKTNTE